ncbi:MAG: SLC13 family permease, partial [Sphaerochaetaceae bacterium]
MESIEKKDFTAKHDNEKFMIKIGLWLIMIFVIWNLPPSGALTKAGVHTIAAFLGMIYGLIFIKEYGIPCLFCILLMGFSGAYGSMNAAFIAAFGNVAFVMMFNILLVGGIVAYTGLAKNIALRMINAKFAAGRPWTLTLVMLVTASFMSTFIAPLIPMIILSEIFVEIFRNLNMKGNRWTLFVLGDLVIMCMTAQNIMPFQGGQAIMFGLLEGFDARLALSNYSGTYILVQMIFQVLLILFAWGFTWLCCRDSVSELKNYKPSEEKYPFSEDMKIALWIIVGYVFIQLFPLVLPAGSSIRMFLETPNVTGWSAFAVCVALFITKKSGHKLMTFDQVSGHGLNWYILLMLAGLGATTGAFNSTGLITWVSDILTPICNSLSPYGIFAVLVVFCFVMTNVTDNIAIMFLAIPVLYAVSISTGMNTAAV